MEIKWWKFYVEKSIGIMILSFQLRHNSLNFIIWLNQSIFLLSIWLFKKFTKHLSIIIRNQNLIESNFMLDTRARINLFDLLCVQVCATRGHGRRAARSFKKNVWINLTIVYYNIWIRLIENVDDSDGEIVSL